MTFPTQTTHGRHVPGAQKHRQGVAAVEFALLCPILLLLFLGIVDVGQFVNVGQSVSNASREGARIAARQATSTTSEAQTAVSNYLTDMHPTMPASAVAVTISDASGSPVSGGDLTTVATGSPIYVQVTVQFDPVRWVNGLTLLDGLSVTKTTVTRRE